MPYKINGNQMAVKKLGITCVIKARKQLQGRFRLVPWLTKGFFKTMIVIIINHFYYERNLSTQKEKKKEHPWFFEKNGH